VADTTGITALGGGIIGMGLSLIGQPLLGLVPAFITLGIYVHKYVRWRATVLKPLREENERLQAELEKLKAERPEAQTL